MGNKVSKSSVLLRAAEIIGTHTMSLPSLHMKAVECAESYTPAVAGNWTGMVGAPAAPDDQDDALNKLAAALKAVSVMSAVADMIVGGTSGAPARLAKGAAYTALMMNSGATAQAWSLIVNANIDAAAAIAVSKLAAGTANHVVKTNSGGTAVESGLLSTANLDPVVLATSTTVTLNALAVIAATTPVQLIAAPAAGNVIVVDEIIVFKDYVAHFTSGSDIAIEYETTGLDIAIIDSAFLTATAADMHLIAKPTCYVTGGTTAGLDVAAQAGKGVFFTVSGSAFADGTDTVVKVAVRYHVVTLLT